MLTPQAVLNFDICKILQVMVNILHLCKECIVHSLKYVKLSNTHIRQNTPISQCGLYPLTHFSDLNLSNYYQFFQINIAVNVYQIIRKLLRYPFSQFVNFPKKYEIGQDEAIPLKVQYINSLINITMLRTVITDYLDRFSGVFTESVYNAKGIEDYNYMRRCYDYLECEKNILSQPRTCPAGLRNIGNTCYLNTILQLLFHINYMRQKLCTTDVLPTKLHQRLQFLFGSMAVGKMPFADPTEVFEQLRAGNSEVFAPGVQNDFHEVFTLLIDCISQGYKKNSPEEARFIKKLLFGKMTTKISYLQETINKAAQFNIINLDCVEGSFNKALQKWKRFAINDFCTPNGQRVTAQCENIFVETPALMGFFINRVTYKNGKLQKDCRPFAFEDSILIAKAFQSDKTVLTKSFTDQKEKQLNAEKNSLKQWMKKSEEKKKNILETIKYLKQKQVPLLSEPTIENPLGEKSRLQCLEYLEKQLGVISKRSQEIEAQISKIQQQMSKLEQQQNCQRYMIWGMMIHEGNSAIFGHYKLCLQLESDWYEFNDKIVTKISRQSLEKYNQRGEICCLFYRRPTLICDNKKIPIPFQLKSNVSQYQNNLKADIDKSRVLQILYQQTESVSILLEYEMQRWQYETYQFFFKPIHFALSQKYNSQICKGIVLQEQINSQNFIVSLKEKLINDKEDIKLPINSFKPLQPYFQIRKHLCAFFNREITTFEVGTAYNQLSKAQLKFSKNSKGNQILNEMIEVIALKGLYYFKFFSEMEFQNSTKILSDLSEGLDRLLEKCSTEEFMLVSISIKASIQADAQDKKPKEKVQLIFQNSQIQDYGQYFTKGFKFWIDQRKNLGQLDETNFLKDCPSFKSKLKVT